MLNLQSLQLCLSGGLSAANVRILFEILQSFLCISYGAGVRTLSRYTDYSERTLFRFIENAIDWKVIFVKIFKQFLYSESGCDFNLM